MKTNKTQNMKRLTLSLTITLMALTFSGCKFFKAPKQLKALQGRYDLVAKEKNELKKELQQCDLEIESIQVEMQAQLDSLLSGNTKKSGGTPGTVSSFGEFKYYCIIGSFKNEGYAHRYAEKVNQMAPYGAEVKAGPGGFYMVATSGVNSWSEAVNLKNTLTGISVNTWIYKNN